MENIQIIRAMATGIVEHGHIEVKIDDNSIIFDIQQYSNGNTTVLLDRTASKEVLELLKSNGIELEKDGETVKSENFISYAINMYGNSGSTDNGCWEINGYDELDLEEL